MVGENVSPIDFGSLLMAAGLTHVSLGYEIVNDTSLLAGFETRYLGVRTSPLTIQVCRQDMTHVALGI